MPRGIDPGATIWLMADRGGGQMVLHVWPWAPIPYPLP